MTNKKYVLFVIVFFSVSIKLSAQSIERFVIGSAGSSIQNDKIELSFTVGESVAGSFYTEAVQLSQGFQQAGIEEIATGIELPDYLRHIIVYPNPTNNLFYLDVNSTRNREFSLDVRDLTGRQLISSKMILSSAGHSRHQFDLTGFAPGIYLVMIKANDASVLKVIKLKKE